MDSVCFSQNIRFSQYHFTPTLTNPALVSTKSEASASLNFRQETISTGQNMTSPMATFVMPFFKKANDQRARIAGAGISILNETTGENGFFRTTSILTGFGYNLNVSDISFLSFGLQGGYVQRTINTTGITTEELYLNGFDPSAISDPISSYRDGFPIINSGIVFYSEEAYEIPFELGLSIYNLNKPDISFYDQIVQMPTSIQVFGDFRAYQNHVLSIHPTFRWWQRTKVNQLTIGNRFKYHFIGSPSSKLLQQGIISFNTWYHFKKNVATIGFDVEQPTFKLGVSYGFPMSNQTIQANNAIEFTFAWRKRYLSKVPKKERKKRIKRIRENRSDRKKNKENPDLESKEGEDIGGKGENGEGENGVKEGDDENRDDKPKDNGVYTIQTPTKDTTKVIVRKPIEVKAPIQNRVLDTKDKNLMQKVLYFEKGSDIIDEEKKRHLDQVAKLLLKHPYFIYKIVSYQHPSEELGLSQRRAELLRRQLIENGLKASRIIVDSPSPSKKTQAKVTPILLRKK